MSHGPLANGLKHLPELMIHLSSNGRHLCVLHCLRSVRYLISGRGMMHTLGSILIEGVRLKSGVYIK